ncbi:hypothetical protein LJR220_003347 [Bradyrhizobium sp. LjRoot220]|uniref:hypothetical protein n=1 Tax=Bradyrhizobium sp. LjRoot220 TaxID=3342284 RepID=UPI003ED0FEDD
MRTVQCLALACLVALTFPAIAAEAPASEKATVLDCLTILNGLEEIDGKRTMIVNQGKANEQVVELPFEFGNGRLRQDLARNIGILGIVRRDQQAAAQKVLMEISKGKGEIRPPEQSASAEDKAEYLRQTLEYDRQMRELTARPCPVDGLTRIKASELKLDRNEIRAGALSAVDRILDK